MSPGTRPSHAGMGGHRNRNRTASRRTRPSPPSRPTAPASPAPTASRPRNVESSASDGSAGAPAPVVERSGALPAPGTTAVVVAMVLLVAVSYFPALQGGFVWDDVIFSEEPVVHSPSGLRSIWLSPADIRNEGHYWPLVYTSFWLEHKLWGLNPVGYHAVNVLLHLVNCLLLWILLQRLAVPGAALIALVFAVHPLHVESVAWIIERKDVLSGMFYLTAVLAWIRFREERHPRRYLLALALFTAGMLAKSVVVTLPVALLILHWWRYRRVTPLDLLHLAPFAAVGLAITLGDLAFYTSREPLELAYSLPERALIAARALWFYAGKLVWPANLAVIYPLWTIDTGDLRAWAYLVGAAALAAALWLARGRIGRGPLAGALFFAVTLAPVLGFVDYGYMQFSFVADRFQYLAGIGVLAVIVGAAAHGAARLPHVHRVGATALAVIVVVVLGSLSWRQAGIYRDEVTLFGHVVAHNPAARDAHLNLGKALIDAGRLEEALAASRVAVAQRPDSADAHSNLGLALMNLEHFDAADDALRSARELDPKHKSSLQNTAELLRRRQRYEESVEAYRAVLARDGTYALAYAGMGDALFHLERYDEAIQALSAAVEIQPGLPFASELHVLMGRAQRALERFDAAETHFRRAVALAPDKTAALLELAGMLRAQQRDEEAEALLRRARELQPGDPATLQNVAESLRKQGRHDEAIATYREVLDISPGYALAYAGMGDALFRSRRYEEALAALREALSVQPDLAMAGTLHSLAGQAAQHLERMDEAARHYEAAVDIDPGDAAALDRLALVRFSEQQYDAARALYRRLLELTPDSAQTYSNLGATLYYLGRADEAVASFERALQLDPALETARTGLEALRASAGNG